LSAVAPHTPTDPVPRHSVTNCINCPCTVAVRDDTRVRHPDAECVLAFLDVTRIYARESNPNPNLFCAWLRIVHLADD
jgi:hypothetical protein